MKNFEYMRSCFFVVLCALLWCGCEQKHVAVETPGTKISWKLEEEAWKIDAVLLRRGDEWKALPHPTGEYTLLYSNVPPGTEPKVMHTNTGVAFPERIYKYQQSFWKDATSPVSLNTAGSVFMFYPDKLQVKRDELTFTFENEVASISASWKSDPKFENDIIVTQTLIAKKDGYFSLASPSIAVVPEEELSWATIPGYFQGNEIQRDSVLAYAYGQGIPSFPALFRERCITTAASIIDIEPGISLAVIPEPGLGRDPWADDQNTHEQWNFALSHMNRRGALSPTLYFPVLGEPKSQLKAGDSIQFTFRYSIRNGDWFDNLKHTADDIYGFSKQLSLRSNKTSLARRMESIHTYLTDPKTSMWHLEKFQDLTIGAQSYLGGVVGSNGDAMKNADYGAMWMLGKATGDARIVRDVLPYALNFKLAQQQIAPGFFNGAAMGQYYLRNSKRFVEEWGDFVEPVSLTYYTMLDVGNILLFEPERADLKERLRRGAELLLQWQKPDGSWEVAYDRKTNQPLFTDIKDLRPTFYGLLVAYRILKDTRYLDAAKKGADWLISNGVDKGHFIGVCGDARYAPDFATAQTAQALLDLFLLTGDKQHQLAAIKAAKIYTASIYTHPTASDKEKSVRGVPRKDWEISQTGLSFEHGGIMGSAQRHGPIQLASHAGMFVRMFDITKDSLFINMARAAAIGRDAFVDSSTPGASDYWNAMNKGAGPYPHHAWWQLGWIMDYLLAEAELRSEGQVSFPRGFVTPKVGPHQTYGFESGVIYGEKADLLMRNGFLQFQNGNLEHILAKTPGKRRVFIVLLNDVPRVVTEKVMLNPEAFERHSEIKSITDVRQNQELDATNKLEVSVPPYGMAVYAVEFD